MRSIRFCSGAYLAGDPRIAIYIKDEHHITLFTKSRNIHKRGVLHTIRPEHSDHHELLNKYLPK